ncbi:MAG: cob(I)yrinic acid a,c-diamide adenosyltransferase [Candidatus Levybacteria bacterium]|nr:cob(I)yrinic acid a,c-diamide adenosyltransferase [Candidatus Levybacteria bacterium]
MKIYTKTGDKGKTSLFGGKRVFKSSKRVEAYGTIDELGSMLGMIIAMLSKKKQLTLIVKDLLKIQSTLMDIGGLLARPNADTKQTDIEEIYIADCINFLELKIDSMTDVLDELKNFIMLGGGVNSSYIFVTRAVCRRAERHIVSLDRKESVSPYILKYLNRLSDYLFTLGRFVNKKENKKEVIWKSIVR